MKKRIYYILTIILCLTWGAATTYTHAQDLPTYDNNVFIYVSPAGSFDNVGDSWATAKNNLQSAIDVLYENTDVKNGVKRGYVFVAGTEDNGAAELDGDNATEPSYSAVYIPNRRSTDEADGAQVNTSFRIYPNIYVIGGFRGDEVIPEEGTPERAYCENLKELPNMRWLSSGKRYGKMIALHGEGTQGTLDKSRSWDFKYKSILSGNHHTNTYSFSYDSKRGIYNTTFPLSSYHVVWFGTNGKIDPATAERYAPIVYDVDPADERVQVSAAGSSMLWYNLDETSKTAVVTRSPSGYTGAITIPATITTGGESYKVTGIRNGAFYQCTGVTSVTMGANVTTVGQAAFDGCTGLTTLNLGNVTEVGRFAFYGCTGLTSVTFPSTIDLIERWSFGGCANLATVSIPNTVGYIGRYAFKGTGIDSSTLPVYEKEETSMTGRFKGLPYKSKLSGFTIEGGNANSTNLQGHDHTGFGGGVYMVRNTEIEDCIIHHCSAVQRGGGVYLDGGGDVNYCYIHTCQATGFGMQQGYGGGVCIDYDGQVEHCYITQCAGRAGAGLAICHDPDEYPEETAPMQDPTYYNTYKTHEDLEASAYDPFAKSTLITNCTSNAEGAGVYLNYGGTLDHVTVVNNECIGPDVIYYGQRHGRTGGIYVREAGAVYNSVFWGNKCRVNSDIQFAAFKKQEHFLISVDHSAFSKGDITDWSAVVRKAVINLNDRNFPDAEFNSGNFPMFKNPTTSVGIMHTGGVVNPSNTADGSAYQDAVNWQPLGMSSMRGKGKQIVDVTIATRAELQHANATQDLLGIKFESVSVCGAITNSYHSVQYALMPSVEKAEGRAPGETGNIPTLFVDPSMVATAAENAEGKVGYQEDQAIGGSWAYPLNNLQDAVFYFSQYLVDPIDATNDTEAEYATNSYYYFGEKDDGGNEIHYPNVQILVKEGTMNVAGRGAYLTGHIRTAAIRPVSKMRLYGGYPSSQADDAGDATKTVTGRSPQTLGSFVKADVTGGDFNDHSVHVFSIANHHDVIIDGFRLLGGNGNIAAPPAGSESTPEAVEEWNFYNSVSNGGGLAMNNSMETFRRDMTGNILRNSVIANCAAPEGAAIFVNGNADHSSAGRKCKAELTVVNTVIRNCTAGDTYDDPDRFVAKEDETPATMQITLAGVVVANGAGAKITVRNSDVVNNCGFPFKCEPIDIISTPYSPGSITENTDAGHIEVYNTLTFSNGLRVHADRSDITNTVFCPKESWYNVTGQYIYMGSDILFPNDIVSNLETNHIYRIFTHDKQKNGTSVSTRVDDGSQQGTDGGPAVTVYYPEFVNPSRNVGHSTTDDKSLYGGAVSYEPLPTNPIVNAGNVTVGLDGGTGLSATSAACMGYDMRLAPRTYGGDPDVGAVETQRLPKGGTVLYVTPDGAGKRDGSSWANAIQGNAIYQISAVEGPDLATGDALDTENGTSRVIVSGSDASTAASAVLTSNSKYNGGWGKVWFRKRYTGAETTTTVTNTWTTEKNVYVGGSKDGQEEIIQDGSTPEETIGNPVITGEGTEDGTFTPVYDYDPRYPYGEISGASRSFWRANPYHDLSVDGGWKNADDEAYNSLPKFVSKCNELGWIKNSREERYVGGLQYAVETAAAYNADGSSVPRISGVDSIQVWVSNGIYTDYKGFVMRDKTTVMGGFPAKDGGTPGLDERQALMSAVIDIPKSLPAKDLNSIDYETILQISDVDPKQDDTNLKPSAVKYEDNDLSIIESSQVRTYKYFNKDITHTFTYDPSGSDVTSKYLNYPNMPGGMSSNSIDEDGIRYITYGSEVTNKDVWHVEYPISQEYYYLEITNQSKGDLPVYDYDNPSTLKEKKSSTWKRFSNGSLTGLKLYQVLKNVEAGSYTFTLDMMGGYRKSENNGNGFDGITPSNIYLHIKSGNSELVEPIQLKCLNTNTTNDGRYRAYRKTIEFTMSTSGNVTIMVEVRDGTRNTTARDATYGTDDGRDPSPIPCKYKFDGNNCTGNAWGTKNPNRREFFITNLNLKKVDDKYTEVTETTISGRDVVDPKDDETVASTDYGVVTERTTLRKRVLTMPDICVPTYGAGSVGDPTDAGGGKLGDNLAHTDRATRPNSRTSMPEKIGSTTLPVTQDPRYVAYSNVTWDGFTIRHGFIKNERMAHGGGAGVNMYEGAHLRNCIVINNISACSAVKGGGLFCDGATSTIEGCFVLNNTSTRGTNMTQIQIFAGGMFMYEGTCFNSLFAKNYSHGSAGGVGFCVGRFYNNTIAHNTCNLSEEDALNGGAISIATDAKNNLFVANTIIFGNNGRSIRVRSTVTNANLVNPFIDCYVQSDIAFRRDKPMDQVYTKNIIPWTTDDQTNYGIGNKLVEEVPSAENTPFAADFDENGTFVAGRAASLNDFRLRSDFPDCINKGTEAFAADLFVALRHKNMSESDIYNSDVYQNVSRTVLPDNDVAYAARVQDCRIDMGAYEYDGTRAIEPTLYPESKKAIFFVTEEGYGTASASSASDAACAVKFQKVLDAAGRWRYASYKYMASANPSDPTYDATQYYNNFKIGVLQNELDAAYLQELKANDPELTGSTLDAVLGSYIAKHPEILDDIVVDLDHEDETPKSEEEIHADKVKKAKETLTNDYYSTNLPLLKDYEVIVRLEGNYDDGTDPEWEPFSYVPTRSVNPNSGNENVLMYSLIVPHGIRVEGGYEDSFETPRDVLGRPTNLDGTVNESGGQAYHVVTFTNDLFTVDEKLFNDGTTDLHDQLEFLGKEETYTGTDAEKAAKKEYNRVVLDGVFLQNGNAAGSEEYYQNGGAAIVTDYAHIRNCVVQNNNASGCGGGLYLDERALVSGCIIKNNTADYGAGIYVFEPSSDAGDATSIKTYAHILSSTIANNTATVSAGGLFFATNVRANSVAIWHNNANANPNVAGTDATGMTQLVENYPMNYCGVESRRMAGVNNIELPADASFGVRWDGDMYYETGTGQNYFPITLASVLTRSGMPYASYEEFMNRYPTLETADIFGLNRMAQDLETYSEGEPPVEKTREYVITLAGGDTYAKVKKDNNFIEMGARVLNGSFEVKLEFEHVMKRLFVTTTERLPTEDAVALQKNTLEKERKTRYEDKGAPIPGSTTDEYKQMENDVKMYQQMGSCFLNPFHRLTDALDYIVSVRKATGEDYIKEGKGIDASTGSWVLKEDKGDKTFKSVADVYKDERFEIYVCGGTFYPYRDAYGVQGESRANTFVVPEGVTIVGGVNPEEAGHAYCQEGHPSDTTASGDPDFLTTIEIAGRTLNGASTYQIRLDREHQDRNGNNVNEPWEMEEQTILSGAAVQNDARANVYHVITCLANEEQVGQLPTRKGAGGRELTSLLAEQNPSRGELLGNIEEETQASRDARTIIIDGVTITGGYANKIDVADESRNAQTLTYFRGGGILVEGNWDASFDTKADLPEVLGVARRDIPLMLTSCLVRDNAAGNGGGVYTNGTFYAFSCHFTQNLAIGPVEEEDQKFIPWSAGGAIANNYTVHVWNSLFDNNEARRALPIRNNDEVMRTVGEQEIKNPITNADARQGYAGAISCSETGLVRAANCDFVRNKAVAFPAIYNFFDNNLRAASSALESTDPNYYGKGWHFAVNSIFWGNEATLPADQSIAESTGWGNVFYTSKYGKNWKTTGTGDERKAWHVANFGPKLDVATLTFCSYQEETGREGTVWWSNQDNAKAAPIKSKDYGGTIGELDGLSRLYAGMFTDVLDEYFGYYKNGTPEKPYYKNAVTADPTSKFLPSALDNVNLRYDGNYVYDTKGGTTSWSAISGISDSNTRYATAMSTLDAVAYNYNLVLSKENNVTGGPFFVQPSLSAGVDGYMETANWLVSRLNNTIDTGWGFLKQQVTQPDEHSSLYQTKLLKGEDEEDLTAVGDFDPHSSASVEEQYHDLFGEGFYNLHSKNIHVRFHDIGYPNLLPIGEDIYMTYTHEGETEKMNMRRVSTHPKMGVQDVFIDMGIYEYQYVQLVTAGEETDVIWVGPEEAGRGDGSSCRNATSNLQEAIETLLRSRNDHDKMVKLIEGTYSPQPTVNSQNKAFFVEVPSRTDGITLPRTLDADVTHSVKSLTIRGGYAAGTDDYDDGEQTRDIEANPVVFEMRKETGNSEQSLAHLFIIEDAGEKGCYMNYLTNTNKDFKDNVMPIVLDGITFVNPYSDDHANGGAAIYYKEQYQVQESGSGTNEFTPTTNLLKAKTYETGAVGSEVTHTIPKLLIKNCVIAASGANKGVSAVKIEKGGGSSLIVNTVFHSNSGNPLEAVNTKVVNCTFAKNGGHVRLIDEQEVYYRPKDLAPEAPTPSADYPSGIYNSIIWRDDLANSEAQLIERLQDLTHNKNALTEKGTMPMKYNAISKSTDPTAAGDLYTANEGEVMNNAWLHRTNRNVFLGPNFVDPDGVRPETGTEAEKDLEEKLSRNFHINPSARFINKADADTYLSLVPFYAEQSLQKEITVIKDKVRQPSYIFHSVQRLDRPASVVVGDVSHDFVPEPLIEKNLKGMETTGDFPSQAADAQYPYRRTTATQEDWKGDKVTITRTVTNTQRTHTERELAYKTRWDGAGMELGAYECNAALQRVLYVWEGATNTFDGSSWDHAFKRDNLQNAIDVASIYSTISLPRERAYVFVASDTYLSDKVYVRDGVSVFGGLKNDFYDEAHNTDGVYTDNDINEYINLVRATRDPIAAPEASVSEIIGLQSDNNETPELGFLLDGFVLKATGGEGRPASVSATPFVSDKHLTVLKNCVVTGNTVIDDKPVLDMSKGLLYNTLVYGNTVTTGTPVVQVANSGDSEKKAGVLNCTVVADHAGEVAVASAVEGSVVNTITYNEADQTIGRTEADPAFVQCNTTTDMFAPYMNTTNAYTLPIYLTKERKLHYQLIETSGYINGGQAETTTMESAIFSPYNDYVNYADQPTAGEVVGMAGDRDPLGNPRLIGSAPDVGCFETWKVDGNYAATNGSAGYITNYGGHKYPHRGSVVYVMENANLVVETNEGAATFTGEGALRPGYVLVKNGGSIYGQGNTLEFNYVAAERNFTSQQYALMAMPFVIRHMDASIGTYAYSGETRSTYNYHFLDANSTAWVEAPNPIPANEGWLADLGTSFTGTHRFTGWGTDALTYAYTESGASKTVTLTQYDNRTAGTGSGLDFTREEDMGWNLKGLPYLVANYNTGVASGDDYPMNIPHIFYTDKSTEDYLDNSTVETVQSWESTATLSPGYGFFTQTAVIDVESGENLVFKVPTYSGGEPLLAPARPIVLMRDLDNEGDLLTVNPDEGAPKTINYSLGRDGVKWMMTDAPQLYLLSAAKSRLSLLGAAPTEVDIPLGVSVPEDPRYQDMPRYFTFSLPEPEAFENYQRVWLIDKALNRVTNLVDQTYAAALSPGTDNSRFYLRIGGFPFGNDQRREYIVYAWKRQLHIRGLVEGDHIIVYSATGQRVLDTFASDPEFTAELPQAGGVYAVRVNDFSTKVRNL